MFVGSYIYAAAMEICIAFYSWQCALFCVAGIILSGFTLNVINKKAAKNACLSKSVGQLGWLRYRIC